MSASNAESSPIVPAREAMTFLVSLIGLVVLSVSTGCGGGSTTTMNNQSVAPPVAASVSATIPVGTAPVSVAVDSTANKIYVANYGTAQTRSARCEGTGSNVMVVDGVTHSVSTVTPGEGGVNTLAVVVNPASQSVYAIVQTYYNLWGKGPCALASAALETVIWPQPSAGFCTLCQFGGVAINPTTGTIYLGNYYYYLGGRGLNSYVSIFSSTSSWQTQADIGLAPGVPVAMAANPATNKIYFADGTIREIDGASNTLTSFAAKVVVGGPSALAVNSTTNKLYAADGISKVTVIEGATGAILATIPVGVAPASVAVDEQTNYIYVANAGNSATGDPGSITVINGATNATATLADANAKNPAWVAVNSTTNQIYVANSGSNNVTVIDGAHN
jgi:YVTN family beta-propeller protein